VLKKLYNVVAILAIVNMAALALLLAYLWVGGVITRDRVERVRDALLAESPSEQVPTTQATTSRPAAQASSEKIEQSEDLEEILIRRLDRQRRELEDLLQLTDAARHKLLRDREAFEQGKDRWEQRRKQWEKQQHLDGFKRMLTYLEGVDPKVAKGILRQKKDPDVARILAAMNERKGKAIIEECVSAEDREWIGRVLQAIERGGADEQHASIVPSAGPGR
jgi:hypothetical protein